MTRKRLKKLLMSYGIQRNEAEDLCYIAWSSGKTYAEWYATDGNTIVALKLLQKSVVKFGMIFKKAACEMAKSIESMALFAKEVICR